MKKISAFACILGLCLISATAFADVWKAQDLPETVREKVRGGVGKMEVRTALAPKTAEEKHAIKEISFRTLEPGNSVGMHKHDTDEDVYLIVSGEATFTDDDGTVHTLHKGDMTICRDGKSHAIANNGQTPMEYFVVLGAK
jgi:Mannose-6-phosphate isomerase